MEEEEEEEEEAEEGADSALAMADATTVVDVLLAVADAHMLL